MEAKVMQAFMIGIFRSFCVGMLTVYDTASAAGVPGSGGVWAPEL